MRLGVGIGAVLAMLFAGWAMAPAVHALQNARPVATDNRIRTVRYGENEVYSFTGHYRYQSSIVFEEGEEIQTVSLGDSLAWQINPTGNRIFLKPIDQMATTNMTVITNERTYLFELHAEETDDIRAENMVFVMRFIYPDEDLATINVSGFDDLPDIYNEPELYNFNYTLRGSERISPIRIFDDGEFTYFEFKETNAEVPAFFVVDGLGNEELVNFRTRDNYIIVERVHSIFTLRSGPEIICVYNEMMQHPLPPPEHRDQDMTPFGF